MLKLQQQTDKAIRGASKSINSLDGALLKATSAARTFATAFGAGFLVGGIATLPTLLRGVVKELADIGDTADKIGITTDRLQELNFQAEQNGASAETMTTALEQFAKRVGEAAQKGGDLAKIFEANGIALKDAEGNLRPLNDLLRDYSNLIKGAVSPSDQFVLAAEAFGRGAGADMVLVLKEGADGLLRFGQEAQRTGQVIREDLVRQAQEVDDKFDQLAGTLATFAKEEVLIFVRNLVDEFNRLSGALQAVRDFAVAGGEALSNLGGANDVEALKEQLAEAEKTLASIQARAAQGIIPGGSLDDAIADVARLRGELAALQAQMGAALPDLRQKDDAIAKLIFPTATTVLPPPKRTGGAGSRAGGISDIEREKKAVIELIAELQREQSLIGATDAERRISNELRRAGASATEAQKAQIASLITQIEAAEAAQQRLIDTLDNVRSASLSALDAFSQSIADGEGAVAGLKSALVDALQTIIQIGQQQIIASLFGGFGGAGGGLFGGIFGKFLGGGASPSSLSAPSLSSFSRSAAAAPVVQLSIVEGALFRPVVTSISGAVSVRHAGAAEQRAIARGPAVARDAQRRFGTP